MSVWMTVGGIQTMIYVGGLANASVEAQERNDIVRVGEYSCGD